MDIKNIFEIIVYILPGFLALEIYRSKFPAKKQTEIEKIALCLLAGIFIYHSALFVEKKVFPNDTNIKMLANSTAKSINNTKSIRTKSSISPNVENNDLPKLRFVIILFLMGYFFGKIFIAYSNFKNYIGHNWSKKCKIFSRFKKSPLSIWAKVNFDSQNNGWAIVFLSDNSIYIGYVSDFTFDPNSLEQDFLLKDAKRLTSELEIDYPISGYGVYLSTKNVVRIEFHNYLNNNS